MTIRFAGLLEPEPEEPPTEQQAVDELAKLCEEILRDCGYYRDGLINSLRGALDVLYKAREPKLTCDMTDEELEEHSKIAKERIKRKLRTWRGQE